MNFSVLTQALQHATFFEKYPVICFTGQPYPLLFFSLLLKNLKKSSGHEIKSINIETATTAELKAQLEVSFLGQTFITWCSDTAVLDAKQKKEFFSYLATYKGPHSVWFFADQDSIKPSDSWLVIPLESRIDWQQFSQLKHLFTDDTMQAQVVFMQQLFKKKEQMQLEECALLVNYTTFLSKQTFDEFYDAWFELLVAPEKSLFDLSTHFFAKNAQRFLPLWKQICTEYASAFWFVYWSDQLFRASSFVQFSSKQEYNHAKKVAYKLPFSFIKKDWKLSTADELNNAHNDLYNFDFHIKNGGSDLWLELFYLKFMTNGYR